MLWFILGLAVIAGFAALLWRQRRSGANWRREISFFVDLFALAATAVIVGVLAFVQLNDPPVQGAVAVAQSTATRPPPPLQTRVRPSLTPTRRASATRPASATLTLVEASPTLTATVPTTTTHTVATGETLGAIAAQYGVPLLALREANGITGDDLSVGQQLVIPLPTPTPAPTLEITATLTATPTLTPTATFTPTVEGTATRTPRPSSRTRTPTPSPTATPAPVTTYTVQEGDTLRAIAERFGVTTQQILALNPGITPDSLRIGTVLTLPPASGSPPAATPAPTTAPQRGTVNYTVQPGDLLTSIAQQFGVTTQQIVTANPGIDADNLRIGQVIRIPNQPLP